MSRQENFMNHASRQFILAEYFSTQPCLMWGVHSGLIQVSAAQKAKHTPGHLEF